MSERPASWALRLLDVYEPAWHCRRCGHFLLPHDIDGHERWHRLEREPEVHRG